MEVYENHEKFLKNPFCPSLNSVMSAPDMEAPGFIDHTNELFDWYKNTIASYHDRKPEILHLDKDSYQEDDLQTLPEQMFKDWSEQKCLDIRKCDLKMMMSSNLKLIYDNGRYKVEQKSAEICQPFDSKECQIRPLDFQLQFLDKWLEQEGRRLELSLGLWSDVENVFNEEQSWKILEQKNERTQ